jgi:peptidoglycan/xylan/chitin deacetylase (PgdA/CDA1 family)
MTLWLISDVDVEFDRFRYNKFEAGGSNPGLTEGLPLLLEFFHKHGIRATLHMQEQANSELSIIERYPKLYDIIDDYGQEVSLHVHVKEDTYERRKEEIGAGYERLKERGYNVESFRAGWYFTNENTIRVLEELGIKYDASPLKGITIGNKKFYDIPDSPYHPSYVDVTRIGNARVLIIPVTDIRLGIGIHRESEYEEALIEKGIDALAAESQKIKEPVVVYFTTHSWKPLTPKGKLREWEARRREYFIRCLSKYEYKTLTVSEAGKLWKKNRYQPYFLNLPHNALKINPWYSFRRYDFFNKYVISNLHVLRYRLFGKL